MATVQVLIRSHPVSKCSIWEGYFKHGSGESHCTNKQPIFVGDHVSKTNGTHEKSVIVILVINPCVQKNKGKVKKIHEAKQAHSRSVPQAVAKGSSSSGKLHAVGKWKSNN